jgi:RimJ/RimL family protein N-acetyltransferase
MSTSQPALVQAPVLETDRLRLRAHRTSDLDYSFAMWADASVTRYIREKPFTREETWARLLRYIGHWQSLGFGYWVVEEKLTGRFVGETGFADYKRELMPSLEGIPEIGWAFVAASHGKGYATEAVRAVVAWGDRHFKAQKTACIIAPANEGSIRVALKAGYREWCRTTYHGAPALMFVREK